MQSPVAIDFETYYDKEYSLRNMNTWAYVFDDRFSAYLVALHSDDLHYVGSVAAAPWDQLSGRPLLMHNASFDDVVLRRLHADGKVPDLKTPAVYDTADLAAYLHCRRDLKTATRELLGRAISKDVRNIMKGRTFDSVKGTDLEQAVVEYGGSDAVQCFDLWNRYSGKWPDNERRISQWNRESGFRGIKVNVELVEKVVEELETAQFNLLRNMPWYPDKPPLSRPALMKEAAKEGIPVPASLANSSEAAVEWEKTYAPKFAWVRSVRHYRRITAVLAKFRTLAGGIRDDGTYAFQLKYFGASQTGRFSGGGGFNMQNLSRLPGMICHSCWGINYEDLDDGWEAEDFNGAQCPFCGGNDLFIFHPRYVFVARDGHSFIATDYSQIEPRVLLWRVGDTKTLDMIRNGLQIYEAHARATMGWTGGKLKDENKLVYALAKARTLGAGYGCGHTKFRDVARMMAGVILTPEESKRTVDEYRASNPKIVARWHKHQLWLTISANRSDPTHEILLPGGRTLCYAKPRKSDRGIVAIGTLGEAPRKLYGGLLTENEIQAIARDIMVEGWIKMQEAGLPPLFTVHDEYIHEVPDDAVGEAKKDIEHLAVTAAEWAEGCPIAADGEVSKRFEKN